MRITNNMVTRNYTKNLHSNRSLLDKFSSQIYTGRKFNKMSEDTSSGVRAMQVRRNLSRIDGYMDNAKAAKNYFTSAETTLLQISELTHSASEKFVKAINGDNGVDEREIIATELEKLRDEMLSLANGKFSDRYMFGGTNVNVAPFSVDNLGTLYYNGVDVSTIQKGDEIMQDAAYMDIGLGVLFNDDIDPTQVDPNSAFKHTLVGVDFLGTGPDNIYLVMTEMIDCLRGSFDPEEAGAILDRFRDSAANVNLAITKLGADTQYLDFTLERLETEQVNLYERQTTLEAAEPEEAIMNFKMQEYVYNAALQMGQRLLQPTLFSFIS